MKVTYDGADILIVDREGRLDAFIACKDKTDKALYNWNRLYFIRTGIEIGCVRTVFGYTLYPLEEKGDEALREFIRERGFKTYHGHV